MYGLPPDFDAQVFVGRTFDSITFMQFAARLEFGEGLQITVEGVFDVVDPLQRSHRHRPPVLESDVMRLLGQQVTEASASTDGLLKLTLDSGTVLSFPDESVQFESYQIRIGSYEIIV